MVEPSRVAAENISELLSPEAAGSLIQEIRAAFTFGESVTQFNPLNDEDLKNYAIALSGSGVADDAVKRVDIILALQDVFQIDGFSPRAQVELQQKIDALVDAVSEADINAAIDSLLAGLDLTDDDARAQADAAVRSIRNATTYGDLNSAVANASSALTAAVGAAQARDAGERQQQARRDLDTLYRNYFGDDEEGREKQRQARELEAQMRSGTSEERDAARDAYNQLFLDHARQTAIRENPNATPAEIDAIAVPRANAATNRAQTFMVANYGLAQDYDVATNGFSTNITPSADNPYSQAHLPPAQSFAIADAETQEVTRT